MSQARIPDRDRILDLARKGHPPREISAMLGMDANTVSGLLCYERRKGNNIPHFKTGPASLAIRGSSSSTHPGVCATHSFLTPRRGVSLYRSLPALCWRPWHATTLWMRSWTMEAVMPERFTENEMLRLAAKAVRKVDLLGPRGTTLCTMEEIDAMACVLALSGVLPSPDQTNKGANAAPSTPSSTGDDQ